MLKYDDQKVNSSIVSKGVMNSFNEMFPLAVMHNHLDDYC